LQRGGVYGTLKEQDTQQTHTGKENGKMKKLIALLLALTLALALAVPASAADEDIGIIGGTDGLTYILVGEDQGTAADDGDIGIIGGADGPTYILVSADPKAAATVSKEEREQNIKALGGVVGQVNVLLGDRCIAFTDAVPEVKNGRTMVPLRFFSQVLDYDVYWDNDYKMAFLLDEETFAEKVDSRLTILNGYLAGNAKRFDASKNYKEDMTLSGTVRVIDSIKGDRSYPYSGKASVLLGKDGMSMSLSADLSALAEYFEELAGEPLPEAYRAAFIKPELEAIYGDKLYYKSPLFDALMAEMDGTQAVSGAWYATDAAMSFGDLWASTYSGNEDYTVGKTIYAAMKQGDANRFYGSWSGTAQLAAAAAELLGDETFAKSGSGYKRHFGKEELAKLLTEAGMDAETVPGFIGDSGIDELSIDLTLRSDGSMELRYTAATSVNEEAALRIDYTIAGNSSRMTAKGTVQVRNVCDVSFDAAVSVRTTSEKPLAVPPAGTTVIELPTAGQK